MPTIVLESCPVCGSHDIKKVFDAVDHFSSGETFPLFDCRGCGFHFTNSFPSRDTIGRYYDSPGYISHSNTREGIVNKLYHFARRIMLKRKVRLVSRYTRTKPARLLDMGCGTGHFLHEAKEEGFIVTGIEKDEKAREYAHAGFGLEVKDEESFWNLESKSFDAITLWHVLEHLEELNESIEKIKSILAPGGTVMIALPNHRSYDAKHYKTFWAAYDVPRHLWHFSPHTVEKLLAKHGLVIAEQKRMPLDAFYISLLSEKYKGTPALPGFVKACWIGTAGLIGSLFSTRQSSSLLYIAKKKAD